MHACVRVGGEGAYRLRPPDSNWMCMASQRRDTTELRQERRWNDLPGHRTAMTEIAWVEALHTDSIPLLSSGSRIVNQDNADQGSRS